MLFDSHKDGVSRKNFDFWECFGFSGGKLGPKMDQSHHLWVRPVFAKTLNFESLFRDCLCVMKDAPLVEISANSSHICKRKALKIPQKGPFHRCCIATKTFENLELDNHKCYTNDTYHNYVPP